MNPDVAEILKTLRDHNLAWMADEIALTINNGKIVKKSYRESGTSGRTRQGTMSVPFDNEEQLEVALTAIKSYMVDLEEAWDLANATFQTSIEPHGELPVKVAILPPEGGAPVEPFGQEVALHRRKLSNLLKRAWPKGSQDFHRKFPSQDS